MNVVKRDVFGGPDGGMGEQTCRRPDVDKPSDLLHGEVARKVPILGSLGQTVMLQGSSTGSARTGGSNRGRGNAGNDVCTLTRAASIAAQVDGCGKQGHNGGDDGANKGSSRSPRWKKVPSRQREHSSPNKRRQEKQDIKPRGPRRKPTFCPHCKALVYHKADKCYELESNKDKRWVGWKSIKETTA